MFRPSNFIILLHRVVYQHSIGVNDDEEHQEADNLFDSMLETHKTIERPRESEWRTGSAENQAQHTSSRALHNVSATDDVRTAAVRAPATESHATDVVISRFMHSCQMSIWQCYARTQITQQCSHAVVRPHSSNMLLP